MDFTGYSSIPKIKREILVIFAVTTMALGLFGVTEAQEKEASVPAVHSNMGVDEEGRYFVEFEGRKIYETLRPPKYTLEGMRGNPQGTDNGILLDFGDEVKSGTLYYGFIPYGDSRHPLPVYLYHAGEIENGEFEININKRFRGKYDMVNWEETGFGTLGFRVANDKGELIYDGKVSFKGKGPFEVIPTMVRGPMVHKVKPDEVTISFILSDEIEAGVQVAGEQFRSREAGKKHEITINGLEANSEYAYKVQFGDLTREYSFKTAPEPGSRTEFTFSYSSDSRAGQGGGERNLYGANYYIVKKIMAMNRNERVAFAQFSGDLINGYLSSTGATMLQYANWMRAVEPFAHYFPIYISMGNHENVARLFRDTVANQTYMLDRFPYETESSEAVFADLVVNPENGPASEDGSAYDPNPEQMDFPTYKENVFSYTYDNVAMVVLNSDYFYAPTGGTIPHVSGNPHAYIMDRQLAWFRETVAQYEQNADIDHIFVTLHTPFFPNGGHVSDDMWYDGSNKPRPYVDGKKAEKGIIERRDQLLEIIVNESDKTVAILTGDEHNYARTQITPETEIYPDDYPHEKLERERSIWQINNGAAGAPYYSQQETPWTPYVDGFTTQNAVVFFHVDGESIEMVVKNPDTLEEVDRLELK